MRVVIITGASSGIGKEFARQIDSRQDIDMIYLIARNKDKLSETAEVLNHDCKLLPLDLSDMSAIEEYKNILDEESPDIRLLINAAGFGKFGRFDDISIDASANMIDLNCRSVVLMCEYSLPYMQSGANIINVSSVASFQPLPLANVYAATKSFVTFYSRGLNRELKQDKITVTALCPGWTDTAFFDRATDTANKEAVTKYPFMLTPKQVVSKALKDSAKKRDISVITLPYKIQHFATKFLPQKTAMWAFIKMQKK